MKHLIRDIFVWGVSVLGIAYLYRALQKRRGPLVRVLCFHDVANSSWFEDVITMLAAEFHVITPEEFHAKNFRSDAINILLTFDDGYHSWVSNALPVLQKYALKGLFFINSGLLDVAGDREMAAAYMQEKLRISPKEPLTWEDAKHLIREGHTIGGHTVSHPDLAQLQSGEVEREIVGDKKVLESHLEIAIENFAYPFGKKNNRNEMVFGAAVEAGYTFIYTTTSSFVPNGLEGEICRTCLEKNQETSTVKLWVEGGYDIFQMVSF